MILSFIQTHPRCTYTSVFEALGATMSRGSIAGRFSELVDHKHIIPIGKQLSKNNVSERIWAYNEKVDEHIDLAVKFAYQPVLSESHIDNIIKLTQNQGASKRALRLAITAVLTGVRLKKVKI
jgi:uncharacterized protein YaaR (DUF327 family)